MLFEDLLPVDCLDTSGFTTYWLSKNKINTIGDIKVWLNDVFDTVDDDISFCREHALKAMRVWHESIAHLGLVTVANERVWSKDRLTVINYVNPRTILQRYTLRFQVDENSFVDDIALSDIALPPASVYWGCQVPNMTAKELLNWNWVALLRHIEDCCLYIHSYVEYFRKICVFEFEPGLKSPFVSRELPDDIGRVVELLNADINVGGKYIEFDAIIDGLLPLRQAVAEKQSSTPDLQQLLLDVDFLTSVFSQPIFRAAARRCITGIIASSHPDGLTVEALESKLPQCLLTLGGTSRYLPKLLAKGIIEEYCYRIYCKSKSYRDYACSLAYPRSQMALYRLEGKSKPEIGELMKVSPPPRAYEFQNLWRNHPYLSEDKYRYWYGKYYLQREEFCQIFGVTEGVFIVFSDTSNRGRGDMEGILQDDRATEEIKTRVQACLVKRKLKAEKREARARAKALNGETESERKRAAEQAAKREALRKLRYDVLRDLLKLKYSDKYGNRPRFRDDYIQYCKDNNLPKSILNNCSVENLVASLKNPSFRYVLLNIYSCMRYYDMDSYDIPALIASLRLEEYNNLLVTTQKVYDDHLEMMQAYDIRDDYELQFVLKQNRSLLPVDIKFKYPPMLEIGKVDLSKQLFKVLKDHAPIERKKLIAILHEMYGFKEGACSTTWLKEFREYFVDGMYRLP